METWDLKTCYWGNSGGLVNSRGMVICFLAGILALLFPVTAMAAGLLTLCYHDVRDHTDADLDPDTMAVSTAHLIEQFDWLLANGYQPVSVEDVLNARSGQKPLPEKAVLLTFDDGLASVYHKVFPLLKLYQFPAAIAVVAGWLEQPSDTQLPFGNTTRSRDYYLTWDQIRTMQASGLVTIASHSYDSHHGVLSNPQGNKQAAITTHIYDMETGLYESDTSTDAQTQPPRHSRAA